MKFGIVFSTFSDGGTSKNYHLYVFIYFENWLVLICFISFISAFSSSLVTLPLSTLHTSIHRDGTGPLCVAGTVLTHCHSGRRQAGIPLRGRDQSYLKCYRHMEERKSNSS